MILGVSGKQGSGKDEVGKIIQYLIAKENYGEAWSDSYEEFIEDTSGGQRFDSGWEIKKYADKLKDIVCLLIGCTREELEDREFKEKELGEEWVCWELEYYDSETYLVSSEDLLEMYDTYIQPKKRYLTPRKLLQLLGTEAGRQIIHPDIWVNSLMSEYPNKDFNWIITDVRFPNELKAVKDRGGISIRVSRPKADRLVGYHYSEVALDDEEFDYVIDNTGNILELTQKIKEILIKEGLL